ncbi:MAG: recombination mediator RecR [Brevinemataceae bacterium]
MLPKSIAKLSKLLTRIPNIGPKNAERLAVWFVTEGRAISESLSQSLIQAGAIIGICESCGYFTESGIENQKCSFCSDIRRDANIICLVENITDVLEIENTHAYSGLYFILGGVISPLEGKTISDLPFQKLKHRVVSENIQEIIIALGATTESDVTTMYVKELLQEYPVKITMLARGIAVGTRISFAGKRSLVEAFKSRENLK